MANKRVTGADIDWYLISIDRLKQVGLIILLIVLAGAGWFTFNNLKANPRKRAETEIANAKAALNSLAGSKDFSKFQDEFGRAQKKFEEANGLFAAGKYPEAEAAAIESQSITKTALDTEPGHDSDAQFLTVEGEVQYQKSSTNDWKKADARTPLFNGDWVKTGSAASAELMFANGSLYTIGPSALLEIYSAVNPSTNKKQNTVQMQVGSVEIATTGDVSTVKTPGSQIVVDSESTTQVGVDKNAKNTDVIAIKGSASITASTGGPAIKIASGERIGATKDGGLSSVRKAALPPALLSPSDNQVFQLTGDSKIGFAWTPLGAISQYQLQVSRSRLFAALEINARRSKPGATAKVTSEGSFYWRAASVSPDGEVGPFSPFRRFRVAGIAANQAPNDADKKPPSLVLKNPRQIGGPFYMIEGRTDPGATVFINDEEVDVDSDGTFKKLISFDKIGRNSIVVKAVSPSGVQTIQPQSVFVEE